MMHLDEGQLHAYLDGQRHDADRHLAECAACRARLEEERALRQRAQAILGAAGPAKLSAPPFEAVLERAARKPASRPRVRRAVALAWAASLALAVTVGWYARSLLLTREQGGATVAALEQTPRADAIRAAPPARRQVAQAVPPRQDTPRPQPLPTSGAGAGAVASAAPALQDRPAANVAADTRMAEAKAEQRVEPAPITVAEAPAPAPAAALRRARDLDLAEPASRVWVSVAPAEAERQLGGPLATIPGLPSLGTSVSGAGPSVAARTIQELGPGLTIELVQQRGTTNEAVRLRAAVPSAPAPAREERAGEPGQSMTVEWEGFSITGRALVPADSLRRLLQALRAAGRLR